MNIERLRRLAWAAVMAEGCFSCQDRRDCEAKERGLALARRRDHRGRAYRTVRNYVVPRVLATRDGEECYIPATLAKVFWHGNFAGNYSWPLLRRPPNADDSDVFSRRDHTNRGGVVAQNPPACGYERANLAQMRRGW